VADLVLDALRPRFDVFEAHAAQSEARMVHLTDLMRQQAYSPDDAMGVLSIDDPTAIYYAPNPSALSGSCPVGHYFYYDVKDFAFGLIEGAFHCLGPGLWVHRVGNELHNVYDTNIASGLPENERRARLNNTLRLSGIWSGVKPLAPSPSAHAAPPPPEHGVAAGSTAAPRRGVLPAPALRHGRDAQSARDRASFVAAASAIQRQAAEAVTAEQTRRSTQSAVGLRRAELARAALLQAKALARSKAAADAALLAAVLDDEENGRFVADEDEEAGAADDAAGDELPPGLAASLAEGERARCVAEAAAAVRFAALVAANARERSVADAETDMAGAAADTPGGTIESGAGISCDDEEDDFTADNEEEVLTDDYGNLYTGTAIEGVGGYYADSHASSWAAVSELPMIPDIESTNAELDGSLVYDSPRGTYLRGTPDYPGASSVTTVRIGNNSLLSFDHAVRRSYDDPHGARRTITFYRIRHTHAR
jgi:hypothetical protein